MTRIITGTVLLLTGAAIVGAWVAVAMVDLRGDVAR